MKRYLVILLLLIALPAYGADAVKTVTGVADSSIKTVTGVTSASIKTLCGIGYNDGDGASCNASTNYIGDKTDYSAAFGATGQYYYTCQLRQSNCASNGTFGAAYVSHHGTTSEEWKVAVYATSKTNPATSPDDDDTLVGSTSATTSSTDDGAGFTTMTGNIGGTATASAYYWECVICGTATGCNHHRAAAAGGTFHSLNSGSSTYYTNPKTTLDGSWTATADRKRQSYVEIGP